MKFLHKNKNKNVKITYFPKDSSYLNAVKNAGSPYCRLCQVAMNSVLKVLYMYMPILTVK